MGIFWVRFAVVRKLSSERQSDLRPCLCHFINAARYREMGGERGRLHKSRRGSYPPVATRDLSEGEPSSCLLGGCFLRSRV